MTDVRWQEAVSNLTSVGYRIIVEGNDLVLKWEQEGKPSQPEIMPLIDILRVHKAQVINYLRLIESPQDKLEKPLLIESGHLKDTFYLVANEAQAQEIEQAGGVCYRPGEIQILLTNSIRMGEEALKDYLNKIHGVKKAFPGAKIQ